MGYNTNFIGELKFKRELTVPELGLINKFLEKESVDIGDGDTGYVDLVLVSDFSGIAWDDGCEKTYDLECVVNVLIDEMQKSIPDFELVGHLTAQGADVEDRWILKIIDGRAERVETPIIGDRINCPLCERDFILEGDTNPNEEVDRLNKENEKYIKEINDLKSQLLEKCITIKSMLGG